MTAPSCHTWSAELPWVQCTTHTHTHTFTHTHTRYQHKHRVVPISSHTVCPRCCRERAGISWGFRLGLWGFCLPLTVNILKRVWDAWKTLFTLHYHIGIVLSRPWYVWYLVWFWICCCCCDVCILFFQGKGLLREFFFYISVGVCPNTDSTKSGGATIYTEGPIICPKCTVPWWCTFGSFLVSSLALSKASHHWRYFEDSSSLKQIDFSLLFFPFLYKDGIFKNRWRMHLLARPHKTSMAAERDAFGRSPTSTRLQQHRPLVSISLYLANPVTLAIPGPVGRWRATGLPLLLQRAPFRSEPKGATNRAVTCSAAQTNQSVLPNPRERVWTCSRLSSSSATRLMPVTFGKMTHQPDRLCHSWRNDARCHYMRADSHTSWNSLPTERILQFLLNPVFIRFFLLKLL